MIIDALNCSLQYWNCEDGTMSLYGLSFSVASEYNRKLNILQNIYDVI